MRTRTAFEKTKFPLLQQGINRKGGLLGNLTVPCFQAINQGNLNFKTGIHQKQILDLNFEKYLTASDHNETGSENPNWMTK